MFVRSLHVSIGIVYSYYSTPKLFSNFPFWNNLENYAGTGTFGGFKICL
jgi:hypothetical protein